MSQEAPFSTGVTLPRRQIGPLASVVRRLAIAAAMLLTMVTIVRADPDGYRDADGNEVSLLDAFYYATVSLSTTGYGDITPITPAARLVNVLLVTPLRVAFLIVLVGTTVEVLTQRSREIIRIRRWRRRLRGHTVVIGYGTKGRSAIATLLENGDQNTTVVVVDPDRDRSEEAADAGHAAVHGDGTRSDVLRRAGVPDAARVLVAADRDDTAALVTLTVRSLNSNATVVAAVREQENAQLLEQSGADTVITTSDAAGRLLGLASVSSSLGRVASDLLSYGEGLEMAERSVLPREEGRSPRDCADLVVAVVRDGEVIRWFEPAAHQLIRGDRLVVVRPAEEAPWAPRPGVDEG
ncbi:MAG: potassium channel family protein [Actinomycetota bacterium]|nr:potassium channel family protein [Actinomycetota bacterium]